MAAVVKISVEGNFKTTVDFKHGTREGSITVSGCGSDGPNEAHIPFYPGEEGPLVVTVHDEEEYLPSADGPN